VEGGLELRDVKAVNLSLLVKWRLRYLQNRITLWKVVLMVKYGARVKVFKCWVSVQWPDFS